MTTVQHNYRDHSQVRDPTQDLLGAERKLRTLQPDRNFPMKLYEMIDQQEENVQGCVEDIVSWQPHGRCFIVHKQMEFVEQILPLWFQQTKFASFQRQLNLYGFTRITVGHDKGAYYHELFLRGKRFLCQRIQRNRLKGMGARKPGSPHLEPNFYAMNYLPTNTEVVLSRNVVMEQQRVVQPMSPIVLSEGTASFAGGLAGNSALWPSFAFDNFRGGPSPENMVFDPPPMMPFSALAAMYGLPQRGTSSSEELNSASLSSLALNLSTKKAPLHSTTHAEALLRLSLAVQPPSDFNALLLEQRSRADAVGVQALANIYSLAQVDQSWAYVLDHLRKSEQANAAKPHY